jgi:hypothetical protein
MNYVGNVFAFARNANLVSLLCSGVLSVLATSSQSYLWLYVLRVGVAAVLHFGVRATLRRFECSWLVCEFGSSVVTSAIMFLWPVAWLQSVLRLAWLLLVTVEAAGSADLLIGASRTVFVHNMHDMLAESDDALNGVVRWFGGRAMMRGAALTLLLSMLTAFVRAVWRESHATPLHGAWLLVGIVLPVMLALAASLTTRMRARKALADALIMSVYVAGVSYFSLAALHRAPLQCDVTLSSLWWGSLWPGASAFFVRAVPPLFTQLVVGAFVFAEALHSGVPPLQVAPVLLALSALTVSGELLHLCGADSADAALWRIASQTIGTTFYYAWLTWGGGADESDDMTPVFEDDDD